MLILKVFNYYQQQQKALQQQLAAFAGLVPLLLRLYLAPVLAQAGWQKYQHFADTVAWFGNADWGLALPWPELMATVAIVAELGGAWLLLLGLATRLVCLPLIVVMLVAIAAVHAPYGWLAIADSGSWLADGTLFYHERVMAAAEKLAAANAILQQHGDYPWLTASGKLVILNNGIEFAATYLLLLCCLLLLGPGRYVSLDDWLSRRLQQQRAASELQR